MTKASILIDPAIHDMTERDIARIEQLALDRPAVLNAVCKCMSVYLETSFVHARPGPLDRDSRERPFSGTLIEVGAFVRGYAIAWHSGRAKQRQLVDRARQFLNDQIEELR